MAIDTSECWIAKERAFRTMQLNDIAFRNPVFDFLNGVSSAVHGQLDLASAFFRHALKRDFRPVDIGPTDVQSFEWYSLQQECLLQGICRWFLEHRHDAYCFMKASGTVDRHLTNHPNVAANGDWRDLQACTFAAAGDWERLVKWMPDAPLRRKHQAGPAKMGWLLARHQLFGELSPEEIDSAWNQFFKASIPTLVEGGDLIALSVWLKMRYWDRVEPKPDPYDAFLRMYDHLLHIPPPPVVR